MKRCEKQYYSPEYPFMQDSNHTAFLNCLIRLPYVLRKVYYISGWASHSPTNMSHYIRHFSFNGDTQTVTLKSTIKTDILFPTFFIFPIDKSPISVYTVYITHKQLNCLLCDVSLLI